MRRARAIGAITLAAFLSGFTGEVSGAAAGLNGVSQRNKAVEHRSGRAGANTNAQWSADPERGWVRADERHRQNEPGGAANKRSDGQQKGERKSKKR